MNKNELRKIIKNKINNKGKGYSIDFSDYIKGDNIAIYYPLKSELDLSNVHILNKKKLYLPFSYKNGKMVFREINNLIIDESNIKSSDGEEIKTDDLDTIIIPGLAYNKNGFRLGHGNGYYDKALENYKGIKIGICFDECFVNDNFEEKHDINVDYVVTEKNIYKIG